MNFDETKAHVATRATAILESVLGRAEPDKVTVYHLLHNEFMVVCPCCHHEPPSRCQAMYHSDGGVIAVDMDARSNSRFSNWRKHVKTHRDGAH